MNTKPRIGRSASSRVASAAIVTTLPLLGLVACSDEAKKQPGSASTLAQPDVGDLKVATDADRVDLATPRFTHPTEVTNPLFPVSEQHSVLLLGKVEGKRFRTEVTLLDDTRVLPWNGGNVEVLVSQYVAFLDDRIHEVAYDLYAQDDDGAVWYFGEDVYNFDDGAIADTHGTWIAGIDGPPAMIMPADPKPGEVYRPENIPGLVFEEVTVKSADQPFDGPFGAGTGALVISEYHADGGTESKTFAPGYGEFYTAADGEVEALALAVPIDKTSGAVPAAITDLATQAMTAYDAAMGGDWTAATGALGQVTSAVASIDPGDLPRLVGPVLSASVDRLRTAIAAREQGSAADAAIDVARSALDLQLRYEPEDAVDLARMDLWLAQTLIDTRAEAWSDVRGDFFAIDYVRDRVRPGLAAEARADLDADLEELLGALEDEEPAAIRETVTSLRELIKEIAAG